MEKKLVQVHKVGEFIYFIDNEEIKEPCWILMTNAKGEQKPLYIENIPENLKYFNMRGGYALDRAICRKIVASTDPKCLEKINLVI